MSEELYRTLVVKLTMLKDREITALDVLDFMDSFLQYAESCSAAPLILSESCWICSIPSRIRIYPQGSSNPWTF